MQKLVCPRGGVTHLTFSPDGDMLAGLGGGPWGAAPTVRCWTRSRDWEAAGLEHKGPLTGVAFHPTGRTLAYAGIGAAWSTPAPPPPPAPSPGAPPPSAWRRRFARETPRPFTGVTLYPLTELDEFVPNRVRVPYAAGAVVQRETWIRGLAFTPDGHFMLAGHVERSGFARALARVYYWHFTENDGVWQVTDPLAAVGATERGGALVGGCLVLAGSWGVAACPVEPTAGLYVPDVQTAVAVAVAPRGELVAACERGAVRVWHLRAADPVAAVPVDPGAVHAIALAPDGQTLAIGHVASTVNFWDARTGAPGPVRDLGVGPVIGLAYAPDGLTLAVAGRTGVVVVDAD